MYMRDLSYLFSALITESTHLAATLHRFAEGFVLDTVKLVPGCSNSLVGEFLYQCVSCFKVLE